MLRRYDIFANKQRFGYQNGRYSKKTATNPQILGFCCTFAAVLIPSPDGGIGRRAGLKHQWGDPCRFDPGSGYYPEPGPKIPFFSSPQRTGGPSGPLSLAYSLRPNTLEPAHELAKVSHISPAHKSHRADARVTLWRITDKRDGRIDQNNE